MFCASGCSSLGFRASAGGASVTLRPQSRLSSAAPPGLVLLGVLADLPARSLAGLAQLGASRPGRLPPASYQVPGAR
jgi:hypothetical protein